MSSSPLTFSIITPSLMRESLIRCCESIDSQQYPHWRHIVALDCPHDEINDILLDRIYHPQRELLCCGQRFGNYGNHARYMAWEKATGDYLVMVDDDNLLYTDHALADIAAALSSATPPLPDFAIFPIMRHGSHFFYDPPGLNMTDTANVVVKRELGRWPDIVAREADGHFVEALKSRHEYAAFPNCEPIVLMEVSSNGV